MDQRSTSVLSLADIVFQCKRFLDVEKAPAFPTLPRESGKPAEKGRRAKK
jgi:hypothetical protein